jgi:hypothetical protein
MMANGSPKKQATTQSEPELPPACDQSAAGEKTTPLRPRIRLPGKKWRLSKFGSELGAHLALREFYAKDDVVVVPDQERSTLMVMEAQTMRTAIEEHVDTVQLCPAGNGQYEVCDKTIGAEDAADLLRCPQFIRRLRKVRMVNNARFPVRRRNGAIVLLPEGYAKESQIITRADCDFVEMTQAEAVKFLRDLHSEFPWREADEERSMSVSLSAMLTLFAYELLPRDSARPGFLYTANDVGAAKTLLAKIAIVPKLGYTPTGMPIDKEEVGKTLLAEAIAGRTVFFMDNVKSHLASGALNAVMSGQVIEGRLLGLRAR